MNTAQTAKNIAQKIARQMAQEPLEVLKDVREQSSPIQNVNQNEEQTKSPEESKNTPSEMDNMKAVRRMEAFQRELEDIRRQEKFSELQRKISQGEEIPLEDYPELSTEQKQVLRAQMEAVKNQKINYQNANDESLPEPAAKKGRRLFSFGKKTAMKREQTHIEKPTPPSG